MKRKDVPNSPNKEKINRNKRIIFVYVCKLEFYTSFLFFTLILYLIFFTDKKQGDLCHFLCNDEDEDGFPCELCGKIYKHRGNMRRHMAYECGKQPIFSCTDCTRKFHQLSNLKRHFETQHKKSVRKLGYFSVWINQRKFLLITRNKLNFVIWNQIDCDFFINLINFCTGKRMIFISIRFFLYLKLI